MVAGGVVVGALVGGGLVGGAVVGGVVDGVGGLVGGGSVAGGFVAGGFVAGGFVTGTDGGGVSASSSAPYTHTARPRGTNPDAQIMSIAGTLTRTQPCDAG